MPYKRPLVLLAVLSALALSACNSSSEEKVAQIRLLHLSPAYDSLDVYVTGGDGDDRLELSSVSFEAISAYATLDFGFYDLRFRRGGSTSTLLTLSQEQLVRNTYATYVTYGSTGRRFAVLKIEENQDPPDDGRAAIQALNVAEAGALDVFLTEPDVSLHDVSPLFSTLSSGERGSARQIDAGVYRLRVTGSDRTDDLRLDIADIELEAGAVLSLLLTPTEGGVLVNAVLLPQRGDPQMLRNASSRVRAAHGVSSATTVSVRLGSRTLMSNATPGTVTQYERIQAGSPSVELGVDGVPVTVDPQPLQAGGDHTLLAWNDDTEVRVALFADDNRLPVGSGKAKLRVINGMSAFGGPINLSIDFFPIAEGIPVGEASDYAEVDSGSDIQFDVFSTATAERLWTRDEISLQGGRVYTLIMTGHDRGTLRQDR